MEQNHRVYWEKQVFLHEAIGLAVAKWCNLEASLVYVFSAASGMPLKTAASIREQFKTFSLLLDVTNAAMICRLEDLQAELTGWSSLRDYISELSGDRNYIAHTPIVAHGQGDPSTADWALAAPRVGPPVTPLMAGLQPKRPPIDEDEVREIAEDIQHAINLIQGFREALHAPGSTPAIFRDKIVRRRPSRSARLGKTPPRQKGPRES